MTLKDVFSSVMGLFEVKSVKIFVWFENSDNDAVFSWVCYLLCK